MDVVQLFHDVRNAQKEIDTLVLEREQIFTRLTSITIRPKEVDVQTSGAGDAMFEHVPDMVDLSKQIDSMINTIARKEYTVNIIIDRVKDARYRNVLRDYYINCLPWSKIADNLHYDPVYIRDLGAKAMQKAIEAGEHLTLSYTIK